MKLPDLSEIQYNGMSASKVTTLLFIHYISGKTIWFWFSLGKTHSSFFPLKYTSLLNNWNQFKALAHTMEKSMKVKS